MAWAVHFLCPHAASRGLKGVIVAPRHKSDTFRHASPHPGWDFFSAAATAPVGVQLHGRCGCEKRARHASRCSMAAGDLDPPLAYLKSSSVVYELEDSETQIGRGEHNDIVRAARCGL